MAVDGRGGGGGAEAAAQGALRGGGGAGQAAPRRRAAAGGRHARHPHHLQHERAQVRGGGLQPPRRVRGPALRARAGAWGRPGRSLGAGWEAALPGVGRRARFLPPAALTPVGRGEQRREAASAFLYVKQTCLCSPHTRKCRSL